MSAEKNYTAFGNYLALHQISYVEAAEALGVTRSYASMLATGKATPGLALAGEIEEWSNGEIPMRYWYDLLKTSNPRGHHRG